MFGNLNASEIEEVLKQQVIGRIGCYANETVYVVPISYAYDGEFVYALTREGMKMHIMRENAQVCFEVEQIENLGNWKSIICWGKFEELKDEEERNKGIQKLLDRMLPMITSKTMQITPQWPFGSDDLSKIKGLVFRIVLNKKTGRFEKSEGISF